MRQFAASGADEAVQSEDFAVVQGEGDVRCGRASSRVPRASRTTRDGSIRRSAISATRSARPIMSETSVWRVISAIGAPLATFLPSRRTVMRSAMAKTSSSLWLTKTIATPSSRSFLSSFEEGGGLVLGDRRGRFVEQQDLGLERQRLGDLDDLHLRDRQAAHFGARVDAGIEQIEIAARLPLDGAIVDEAIPGRQALEQNIFPDAEARDQISLLMNRRDALAQRIARRAELRPGGRSGGRGRNRDE